MSTPGKFRHLARAATPGGHFVVLAIDHRDTLLTGLGGRTSGPADDAEVVAFKRAVVTALAPAGASALLIDPEYGIAPGLMEGWLPGNVGLLAPLEVTDYTVHPSQRGFQPIPGWSPQAMKRAGVDGVKLLFYYHPETADAAHQREVVEQTVEACAAADIAFYLEPIAFSPDPARTLPSAELTDIVIDSARLFSRMGIDVLKSEFPVDVAQVPDPDQWREPLARLNEASVTPWALLSAGVGYETFRVQAEMACAAGASGVIVGRAVWSEAVRLPAAERDAFLNTTGRARMSELAAVCAASAHSFRERTPAPGPFGPGWADPA